MVSLEQILCIFINCTISPSVRVLCVHTIAMYYMNGFPYTCLAYQDDVLGERIMPLWQGQDANIHVLAITLYSMNGISFNFCKSVWNIKMTFFAAQKIMPLSQRSRSHLQLKC